MNDIQWTTKAFRQLRKLPQRHQIQIRDAVSELTAMPEVNHVKALKQHTAEYRMRVGRFRVLFDWNKGIKVVSIIEVKKRDERTY